MKIIEVAKTIHIHTAIIRFIICKGSVLSDYFGQSLEYLPTVMHFYANIFVTSVNIIIPSTSYTFKCFLTDTTLPTPPMTIPKMA